VRSHILNIKLLEGVAISVVKGAGDLGEDRLCSSRLQICVVAASKLVIQVLNIT
jgi:hypothetical protein